MDIPVLPDGHVARPRLRRKIGNQRVALVHAHGGWGKSTLATELAAQHRGTVTWIDLRDEDLSTSALLRRLLDPLGLDRLLPEDTQDKDVSADVSVAISSALKRRPRPILVVVDEVQPSHWPALQVLATGIVDPHRLVVLSRRRLPGSEHATTAADWAILDSTDLAFSIEEFQLMLAEHVVGDLPRGMAEALRTASGGWSTLLRSVVNALAKSTSPSDLGQRLLSDNVVLDALVTDLVAPLSRKDREGLSIAARLPHLDRRLARQMGLEPAITAAQEAGLPWQTPPVGPWTLPDPVALLVADDEPLCPAVLTDVTAAYVRAGEYLLAARVAVDNAAVDLAARTIANAPIDKLSELFKPSVLAFIDSLGPDVNDRHPQLDVQVARLLTASARYSERNAFVARRVPAHRDRPEIAMALEGERFRDLAYFSPTPDPADIARAEALLATCDDLATRSRLEQGLALLLARRDGVDAAENGLRRAAEAAERAGELPQAALALRDLAWVVLLDQGKLRQVVETFDRIELMLGTDNRMTSYRINRADTLLHLGEMEAAERDLDDAVRLAELAHNDLHISYAAWARARLESQRGHALKTLAAVERAQTTAGDWIDTSTGVLFYAQVADALARVGLQAEARRHLGRASARAEEDQRTVDAAQFAVECRLGAPAVALALWDPTLPGDVEPFEAPRLMLLHSLAVHRSGEDASDLAGRAFAAYQAQGLLDAVAHVEPEICALLVPLARGVGAPVPQMAKEGVVSGPAPEMTDDRLTHVLGRDYGLRPREIDVLLALRQGGRNAEIATTLGISPATVRKHLQHAYAGLDVRSRTEALVKLADLTAQP